MRSRAAAVILVALAALLGTATQGLSVSPSASTESSAAGERAFSEIAGCVSGADTLLAAVVVDESASLRSTDPKALRVPAITTAIDALEDLQASAGRGLSVEVSMSTFARGYHQLVDWGELNHRHAERLRRTAATQLPRRDFGNATDYRQALQGAQRQLDDRADKARGGAVCKVMLWFTDGALDVDGATQSAANELCRPRGIADAVRSDQISVIALALFARGGSVTPAQRDQLRAVAEGRGQGTICGTNPIPSDASSGVYLSADDPAALRRLFAGATALMSGAGGGPTAECPSAACPAGRFAFNLDPGVGGFRFVVDVGNHGASPTLVDPDKQRIRLPASGTRSVAVAGGTLEVFGRDGLVTATMLSDSLDERSSRWVLDLGHSGGAVDLYWYWGAALRGEVPELVAGSTSEVRGVIAGPDGQPVDLRMYRRLDIDVRVNAQPVPTSVNPDGSFVAEVTLPGDSGSSEATIDVAATARTRGSDIELGPLTLRDTVPITLPPAFPALSPSQLRLGDLEGVGVRSAVVELTGSKLGPTQVCFTGSTVAGPGGAAVDARSPGQGCARLGTGERSRLRVDLEPAVAVDGLASGDLRFEVTGADDSGTIRVLIPTKFDMTRPVDESTRWTLVALLVGLAVLIPVLLLLLAEWLLARFEVTPTHQTAAVPVRLTAAGPQRVTGGTLLQNRDLTNLALSKRQRFRRYAVPGSLSVLRVRRWWDFARGSKGVVAVPPGSLVASKHPPFSGQGGHEAEVALGPANTWFVVADAATVQASEAPNATLVVLFPTDEEPLGQRISDIGAAPWESILAVLHDHAKAAKPRPTPGGRDVVAEPDRGDDVADVPSWMTQSAAESAAGADPDGGLPSWVSGDTDSSGATSSRPATRSRRDRRDEPPPERTDTGDPPPMDFLK